MAKKSSVKQRSDSWARIMRHSAERGNAYGGGGLNNTFCNNGCGTVFESTKLANGKFREKAIHRFTGEYADGCNPLGGLVFDKSGNLWGTPQVGGHTQSTGSSDRLSGTVFELTPNANGTWTESTLFSFRDSTRSWAVLRFSALSAERLPHRPIGFTLPLFRSS